MTSVYLYNLMIFVFQFVHCMPRDCLPHLTLPYTQVEQPYKIPVSTEATVG